jgi:hypothetical protein
MEPSYKVWVDPVKNRLYLVLKGSIPDDMAKAAADKTIEEAQKLQSGFFVINDISEMQPAGFKGAAEIKRAQAFLGYLGVRRIIRVVPQTGLEAKKQFENPIQGYPVANTAFSIEEADAILDKSV